MADKNKVLWHQSGVNRKGEPFVQLGTEGKMICQMTPDQARDHARVITEAAEAAEQDAFMMEFFSKKVGTDINRAMLLIVEFRKWREERGKHGPPSEAREFIRTDEHEEPEPLGGE